jgi:hypothetical protein
MLHVLVCRVVDGPICSSQFTLFVMSIDCFLENDEVVGERMKHTLMLILTCISFKLVTSAYTPKTYYSNFMVGIHLSELGNQSHVCDKYPPPASSCLCCCCCCDAARDLLRIELDDDARNEADAGADGSETPRV